MKRILKEALVRKIQEINIQTLNKLQWYIKKMDVRKTFFFLLIL